LIKRIFENQKEVIFGEILHAASIKKLKVFKRKIENHLKINQVREIKTFSEYYYMGHPNVLQDVLLELIHYNPIEIKVYGVNFFIEQDSYEKNYVLDEHNDNERFWKSHAGHNILTQFKITKLLLKHPLIVFEKQIKNILEQSNIEYLSKIKSTYTDKYLF
jgi:hypothetical protein